MKTNIFNAIKVSTLAIVLSFGLSYVYAWTTPSGTPPTGNVSAPLNTSSVAQAKAGALTVGSIISGAATTASLDAGNGTIKTLGFLSGAEVITNKITFSDGSSVTTSPIPHGKQRFTATSGTFTVPARVTKVWVTMNGDLCVSRG